MATSDSAYVFAKNTISLVTSYKCIVLGSPVILGDAMTMA